MIYLSAQPAIDYYSWQVEVYLINFLSLGIDGKDIHVVNSLDNDIIPLNWQKLKSSFPSVNFYFYKDTRVDKRYVPSIQAHVLEKHFKANPYLEKESVFFHDSDFIFSKKFDFEPYLKDDIWYFSNTISYIGASYIKSKSPILLDIMCDIVGIDKEIVENNQNNSGGAQKLLKNVTSEYWKEVEYNSNKLYSIPNLGKYKKLTDPNPLQIWCASMWSELWTGWKYGNEIKVVKEFDFCWATDNIDKWSTVSFFHNAGVVDSSSGLFYKGDYITKLPYNTELELDDTKCSYLYYELIKKVAKKETCSKLFKV